MARVLPVPANSPDDGRFIPRTETPEYQAWANAIYRCENPNAQQWALYGGRGISVHPAWRSDFEAFLRDLGPRPSARHTLERRDVNGDYEPGNCCWATPLEQAQNRRNTRRVAGLSPRQLSERTGMPLTTIRGRLARGWSHDRILAQPRRNLPVVAC